ncbi:hypothetical protein [Pseudobutyrivibrio xylanivorans]|uniref:Glycosyltransferase RgtA/B/C/D-like domain-containing protein n=1 Tax=Pseudobutyrivibrio xylanivorans TaxID=185007 RepID=A0A1G5S4K3_PSEXY|nr:hypothetical protein [Pseudobutyrivibrio xylanivorans]SCZ81253.1 hypothetical protein SAMN02910350_02714 [Pseudobutyrivibrio xylanivorans]
MNIVYSLIFWISIVLMVILVNPNLKINRITIKDATPKEWRLGIALIIYVIIVCLLPMDLSPTYNGERQNQRQQYEKQAEAFAAGHLYLDLEPSPELLAMENPYDRNARDAEDVQFEYDTAYYKGHYYMYFGVTPVVLVYLPYLLITGHSLLGFRGTQIIVTVLIFAMCLLFKKLSDIFFKEMKFGSYIMLCATMSIISVWYAVGAPSLYTVPNVMGICVELFSFFFYLKAVYDDCGENRSIVYAVLGGLFGALAFGCRPTIAFANFFAIPLVVTYFRRRGFSIKLLLKLLFVAIPYAVCGGLIMAYNYLRFENPFEFGQSYQLTTEDQSQYMSMLSRLNLKEEIHGIVHYFVISSRDINLLELGAFVSFPILLFIVFAIFNRKTFGEMKKDKMIASVVTLVLINIFIAAMDTLWSPYFWPRYRMDIYWLVGVLAFIAIGYCFRVYENSKALTVVIAVLCDISIAMCFLMCIYPFDHNFTFDFNLTVMDVVKSLVTFGMVQ